MRKREPTKEAVVGIKDRFYGLVGPPGAIFEEKHNLLNQEEKFRISKMALNHVLIVQPYSTRRELQESYLNIFYLPIFDRFMAYRRSKTKLVPVSYIVLLDSMKFWEWRSIKATD